MRAPSWQLRCPRCREVWQGNTLTKTRPEAALTSLPSVSAAAPRTDEEPSAKRVPSNMPLAGLLASKTGNPVDEVSLARRRAHSRTLSVRSFLHTWHRRKKWHSSSLPPTMACTKLVFLVTMHLALCLQMSNMMVGLDENVGKITTHT